MADALYAKARNGFSRGDIHWKSGGDAFRAYLVDIEGEGGDSSADSSGSDFYTVDLANDEFLAVIPAEARVAWAELFPADPVAGVHDAPDVTFLAVAHPYPCEAVVIVKWVTSPADSPLIAYIDSAVGLPVTPNGTDIPVTWDDGVNKIFKL